jgi:chromosome segregation ATPase
VLTETRDELYESITQLEDNIRKMHNDLSGKDDDIDRLQKKIDRFYSDKNNQDRSVEELHSRLAQMKDELTHMNADADLVAELKRELSIIPELNHEMTKLKEHLNATKDALDIERTKRKMSFDETQRLQEINTHMNNHLDDIKNENGELRSTIEELQRTKMELEFANKELTHFKETNSKLTSDVSKMKRQREDKDSITSSSMQVLSSELFAIQRLVEIALLGTEQINAEHVNSVLDSSKFEPLEVIKPVLLTLRNNMADTAAECCALRERNKHMQHEIENYRVALQEKEHERTETYKEFIASKREYSEQERILEQTEAEKSEIHLRAHQLELQVEQSKLDERSRIRSLYNAFKKLKAHPTDHRRDGSPSKSRTKVAESSENIAWETLQSMFMDQISTHIVERESLTNEAFTLNAKVLSLDAQLERARQEIVDLSDRMEKDLTQAERSKITELEVQRQHNENEREILVTTFNAKTRELEEQVNELTEELNENIGKNRKITMLVEVLKSEIKGLQHERDRLSWCIRLLARGIRPMRDRISDLREQRKYLETEVKHLERSHKGVVDSVKTLTDAPQKPAPKTSLRAAAVAIIAARRLQNLVIEKKRDVVMSLGNDRIHLLPPNQVVQEIDVSQLPYDDDASVQRFLQVCSVLDPQFDAGNTDYTLILTLQDGLEANLSEGFENIAHKGPLRRGLDEVQKSAIQITRTMRELMRDKNTLKSEVHESANRITRLQSASSELEANNRKKQELIEYMEQRVTDLQEDNMRLVQPEKYELMQTEVDKVRKNYSQVLYEREQFKNEFENHVDSLNTYRRETQSLQDEIREKGHKIESISRELRILKEENSVLLSNNKKHSDIMRELEVEKDKYQMMVSELRDKLFKRAGASSSSSTISEVDDSTISSRGQRERDADIEALGRIDTSSVRRSILNSSGFSNHSTSPSDVAPSFHSVRKRVERDLNASSQMMKTLSQNNARNTHEVLELDRELRNARAHLAELQSKKMTGSTSPFAVSPLSPNRKNSSMSSSITSEDFDDDVYSFSSSKRKKNNLF